MTVMALTNFLLFFAASAVFAAAMEGEILSTELDSELDRQLKLLNKPAIKSIQGTDGGTIDCVDIRKQPAFDHPLLKNHTLQMRPSSLPDRTSDESSSKSTAHAGLGRQSCPKGTVPIRRIQKEDLLRIKSFTKISEDVNMYHPLDDSSKQFSYHNAVLRTYGEHHGTRARLNVWGLNVNQNQFSSSKIWIQNGPDTIQAGWTINPGLFGDSRTRLYTSWTAVNKQGCVNLFCQGFVQVDKQITLGNPIEPLSVYDGPNYEILLTIFKDPSQGNWWLVYGGKHVGYWPKSLFTDLAKGGSVFTWGGEVYSTANEPSPPMGSGHFPMELYRKACYTMEIQLVDSQNRLVDPEKADIIQDRFDCYYATESKGKGPGRSLYFGGPGNYDEPLIFQEDKQNERW